MTDCPTNFPRARAYMVSFVGERVTPVIASHLREASHLRPGLFPNCLAGETKGQPGRRHAETGPYRVMTPGVKLAFARGCGIAGVRSRSANG